MSNSWLLLLKSEDRVFAGNLGYEDVAERFYSWDSRVPNHEKLQPGDKIVLWNGKYSLGVSSIESIETKENQSKEIRRCPFCKTTDIRERKTLSPKFKCGKGECRKEFDETQVEIESVEIKTYRSNHEIAWVDLNGKYSDIELRNSCVGFNHQHSLRRLDWNKFTDLIKGDDIEKEVNQKTNYVTNTIKQTSGGSAMRLTKVRIGQGAFRRNLLEKFKNCCAITGLSPEQSLEAAHLYSYAGLDRHEEGGGLLLRRDVHRLFDLGLILINPRTLKISVSETLRGFDVYSDLHGMDLRVKIGKNEKKWLKLHWERFAEK